jgi:hypothetical protein
VFKMQDNFRVSKFYMTIIFDKLTVVIIGGYHCYQLHTKYYPIVSSQG